jgi:hypothetical protein
MYVAAVRRGVTLLAVDADGMMGDRVTALIEQHGPIDVAERNSGRIAGGATDHAWNRARREADL